MNICIVTQYYFPETGATSNRIKSLASACVARGHNVTIICECPNHPAGVVFPGFRNRLRPTVRFESNRVKVVHTWVRTKPVKKGKDRLIFYGSFMVSAALAGIVTRDKFDAIVASSPPLFVGAAGLAIAAARRVPFVFDVRDLWPDVALAMGELRPGRAATLATKLERRLYRSAALVTCATSGFAQVIRSKCPKARVEVVPNGADLDSLHVAEDRAKLRKALEIEGFTVGYVGNLGLAQGLTHILEAAYIAQRTDLEIKFLFVGEGPMKPALEAMAAERDLANVRFVGRQSQADAARYMKAMDALLVPLGANEIYRIFRPSKLFDSMALGRPVLLSVPGESQAILEEARGGVYYEPESAVGLVEAVKKLLNEPMDCSEAVDYVRTRYDRATIGQAFVQKIEGVANGC